MPTATPSTRENKIDAQVFWFRYHKEILAFVLVAILAALGYAGYRFYTAHRDSAAAALLGKAKTPSDYQQVIAQYPSAPAAASAYLLLGEAQRNEKKFADSNQTLDRFVQKHPKHELVPAARVAIAANDESLGRNDEALSIYQQVASSFPKSYVAPYAMISQMRLLRAKGQDEAARLVAEKILTEHSDSRWAGDAMRQLRELTPKETPAPVPNIGARSTSSPAQGAAPPPLLARPAGAPAPSAPPKPK
jgi:tetratricopeptide (TPR) repeat protein